MNTETETERATAEANCAACGQGFLYEPILLMGRDLARSLHTHCEDCQRRIDAELARADREREQQRRRDLVRHTLPPELLPKDLDPLGTDTADPTFNLTAWRAIRQWRPNAHGSWLALVGPAGECKTRCLGLLAANLIMAGNRVTWTSAMRLHAEATMGLRARDRQAAQIAREHLDECRTSPWLILDDLGNNEWSPAFESQLFTILDYRKNHRLPLAYSSNAHPREFHHCITSVNSAALIGRLTDRTEIFQFAPDTQLELP